MANATCTSCGASHSWRAGRGARLADHRCTECGGTLRGAAADGGRLSTKGRKIAPCAICGRKRYLLREVTEPTDFYDWGHEGPRHVEAGGKVCHRHTLWSERVADVRGAAADGNPHAVEWLARHGLQPAESTA